MPLHRETMVDEFITMEKPIDGVRSFVIPLAGFEVVVYLADKEENIPFEGIQITHDGEDVTSAFVTQIKEKEGKLDVASTGENLLKILNLIWVQIWGEE